MTLHREKQALTALYWQMLMGFGKFYLLSFIMNQNYNESTTSFTAHYG